MAVAITNCEKDDNPASEFKAIFNDFIFQLFLFFFVITRLHIHHLKKNKLFSFDEAQVRKNINHNHTENTGKKDTSYLCNIYVG